MEYKNIFKHLYFILIFLVFMPIINAQSGLTDILSDIFGTSIDASFTFLIISLFVILFAILQKGTKMIFPGGIANVVSFLVALIALIFMPDEFLTFMANYTVFIVAIAFIVFPIILINLIGFHNKRVKHFILLLIYIGIMWGISKLSSTSNFRGFFELTLPWFGGEIEIIRLAYFALVLAIIISLFIIFKESNIIRRGREFQDTEKGMFKARTFKEKAEEKIYKHQLKDMKEKYKDSKKDKRNERWGEAGADIGRTLGTGYGVYKNWKKKRIEKKKRLSRQEMLLRNKK